MLAAIRRASLRVNQPNPRFCSVCLARVLYASPLPRSQRLCAPDKKRFDTAKTQSGHRLSAQQPRLGESIRLVDADTWSKRLIVELAKSSGLLVEKKRKECISASPCDAGNRVHQRARKYDGAADRRLAFEAMHKLNANDERTSMVAPLYQVRPPERKDK